MFATQGQHRTAPGWGSATDVTANTGSASDCTRMGLMTQPPMYPAPMDCRAASNGASAGSVEVGITSVAEPSPGLEASTVMPPAAEA